jgi:DNA (cytosine-5)-methyltransferase 1
MRLTIALKNGSLHQFVRKVKNRDGKVVEYPKVKGERDPNNPRHWQWQLSWKEKVDNKWRTRCLSVPANKALKVRKMIAEAVK